MTLGRDAIWLLAALLFGALALPWLVYFTGVAALGPYAHGGPAGFFADYLSDLLRLRWYAWSLALGPLFMIAVWRVVARVAVKSAAD